jgi:hypothetical protein
MIYFRMMMTMMMIMSYECEIIQICYIACHNDDDFQPSDSYFHQNLFPYFKDYKLMTNYKVFFTFYISPSGLQV